MWDESYVFSAVECFVIGENQTTFTGVRWILIIAIMIRGSDGNKWTILFPIETAIFHLIAIPSLSECPMALVQCSCGWKTRALEEIALAWKEQRPEWMCRSKCQLQRFFVCGRLGARRPNSSIVSQNSICSCMFQARVKVNRRRLQ